MGTKYPWTGRALRITCSAVAGVLAAAQASAQAVESVEARVTLVEAASITRVGDLDFGQIVGVTGGTIVLSPDETATCDTTGGLVHSGSCVAAAFGGAGATGERLRIRRPIGNTIVLSGPGADMTVTNITFGAAAGLTPVQSNPSWERFRIDAPDGVFLFRVGGTLNVNADQAPGIYTGTFEIRIDYQ